MMHIIGLGRVAALCTVLLLAACGGGSNSGDSSSQGTATVRVGLGTAVSKAAVLRAAVAKAVTGNPASELAGVTAVNLTVSAADMATVSVALPLDGSSVTLNIPAGLNRVFSASAYNAANTLTHSGATTVAKLVAGAQTSVPIALTAVTPASGIASYNVGGMVSGLAGSVVLQDNNGDNLIVAANGTFTFATSITNGSTYSVTVLTQPSGQTCSVSTGAGTVSGGNVSNVAVVCATNTYNVGGSVSGLVGSVVLQDNNGDNLSVTANGVFTFATKVANGSPYSVTVFTQPAGQSCSVTSGTGTIAAANVSNVAITCLANTYTISGTVTGLSGSMVLQDNGGDNLSVSTNGTFTFATAVANGNTYSVTVFTQPIGQTCNVTGGSGTVSGNATNVAVACATNTYNVGGSVSGLVGSVVLQDNNGDNLLVSANGAFTFATKVANGSTYSVTVLTQPAGQSCSVASGTGTIALTAVSNVAVTCAANTYTIGGTVTGLSGSMVLQDNNGDNLSVSTNGTFTFATAVANGNTYSVTVFTQPIGQTCNVTGGSGTVSTNVTNVAMNCVNSTTSRFAYVANYSDNTVSMYTVNAATGQLRANGYVAAGTNPYSVTVDPTGKFAYVANVTSNDVSAYTINAATGALTQINCGGVAGCNLTTGLTANFAAGSQPGSVTIDPSGKFAYVANIFSNDVSAYTINASTGALTSVGAAVAAGTGPASVTIDPTGKFAYVANNGSNDVSAYTINASTGALTSVGVAVAAGTAPISVSVDPSGKFAYVANQASSNISAYTINASTGALTSVGAAVAAGAQPDSVTVDPSGKFAYVANQTSNDVSAYTINASTGALTSVGVAVAGTTPYSVSVDPSGKFAYVASFTSNDVSAYSINATTGALTPLGTVSARAGSVSIAMSKGTLAVTYTPKFAYVANVTSNNVSAYTINATSGALTSVGAAVVAGTTPISVTVDPSGKFAYVANLNSNNVSAYTINASTGALTSVGVAAAGTNPISVTVDPSGKFAYVANRTSNDVSAYTINAATGALTQINCGGGAGCNQTVGLTANFAAGGTPQFVSVDPTGRFAYVANGNSNNVSAYTINASTGALTSAGVALVAGSGPISVTVDPSGKFAYVANYTSNNVSAYTINASTGALTSVGVAVAAGTNPTPVTVDPSGKFAYVANFNSNDVSAYTINASTGALTSAGAVVAVGTSPVSITVDPSGKFAYVANYTSNDVSAYTINASTGALTSAGASVPAGTTPRSIVTTGTIQ